MIPPPRFVFTELNKRCNLRCEHCNYHLRNDDSREFYLGQQRIEEIAAEFAELNPAGTLVTCGGEPMLDIEDYFHYTTTARRFGLQCFSVVNGTRVTRTNAERIVCEGPTEITVSIDSPFEEKHDRWRGVNGSWRVATQAVRRILDARNGGAFPKVNVMLILCERSWRDLPAYYQLVLDDLKADRAKLNVIQPTFGGTASDDAFFAANIVRDTVGLHELLQACDTRWNLRLNPQWIAQVIGYFDALVKPETLCIPTARLTGVAGREPGKGWRSQMGTSEHICNTYERNVMIDTTGLARLCFSSGFKGMPLRQRGDLRKFWYDFAPVVRESMKSCNRYCGISHSVRRQHATVKLDGVSAW